MIKKSIIIKQDAFPVKISLLEKNPYGNCVRIGGIKLFLNKPIIIYTQSDLNKFEPILNYIDLETVIENEFEYDEIIDSSDNSSN